MSSPQVALVLLATWGGVGYTPGAPGTVASAIAVALGYLLVAGLGMPAAWLAACAALLFWPGCLAAAAGERHFGRPDPTEVVVDEIVGQWIALAAVHAGRWQDWAAAFLLFRVFDIVKPFYIRRLEAIPGGWGVMADDAAAGFCAMIGVLGVRWFSVW